MGETDDVEVGLSVPEAPFKEMMMNREPVKLYAVKSVPMDKPWIVMMPEGKDPSKLCSECVREDDFPRCDVKHWADCPLLKARPAHPVPNDGSGRLSIPITTARRFGFCGETVDLFAVKVD